ncbi:acyloxyacyl hydrolase [Thioalkalivibrio sp.]|uniref:acyloxyacyl hydrolase n=1 Tax=Thioalkalivibrio sp. TaxID=2093813 RepID=UPI00356260DE
MKNDRLTPTSRCRRSRLLAVIVPLFMLAIPPLAQAESGSFGLRGGSSVGDGGERFAATELFLRHPLPWGRRLAGGWRFTTQFEAGLAMLERGEDTASALSVGPVGVLKRDGSRWHFEIGVKPTLLSEDRFGARDLGGQFHFTSHAGIRYELRPRISLGYRLQHTSNAGISSPNPGLDLQLLTLDLAYR